jgi:hypothetical protein
LAGVPLVWLLSTLASLDPVLSAVETVFRGGEDISALAAVDYYPQAPPGRRRALEPLDAPPPREEQIRPTDLDSVRMIATLCRDSGIRCIYMHGPVIRPQCGAAKDYVRALDERIEAAGLPVARGTPVCMPRADAGDSEDHVAPDRKAYYSARYLELALAALHRPVEPQIVWIDPPT